MPAIIAALLTGLGWSMKFFLAKALLALGLQIALVAGMDTLLDYVIDQAFAQLAALDSTVYMIVRLARIPDAIAVLSAAALVKHSLVGAGKLMFVARGGA